MDITIANISGMDGPTLQAAVAAIGRQVTEHFQPEWGLGGTLTVTAVVLGQQQAPIPAIQDAVIYIGNSSQDPTSGVDGTLGYHFQNFAHVPYGFVYLDVCAKANEPWTVSLSHEVLELLGDPEVTQTVTGPAPGGAAGLAAYDLEVADPTQGDSYLIDGVSVSNFVGRAYFGQSGGSGRTNYLDLPLAAFGVRPKGYFQWEDGNGGANTVKGFLVTDEQFAAKTLLKSGRRNERRRQRLAGATAAKKGKQARRG
ncbi:MAG TPA: hypothetical protein VK914_02205 [bacterium]|jgi:hypothetical protein|nr:hypothetical protein [bacterium]